MQASRRMALEQLPPLRPARKRSRRNRVRVDRAGSAEATDRQPRKDIPDPRLAPKTAGREPGPPSEEKEYVFTILEAASKESSPPNPQLFSISAPPRGACFAPGQHPDLRDVSAQRPAEASLRTATKTGRSGGRAKSLFPILQSLCDEGLVAVDVDSGWRTYWLTEAGKTELEPEAAEVKKVTTIGGGPGSRPPFGR